MKFNGTIFSKPQQDQLKEKIGNELEKVSAKVDEVGAHMLNYKGDWATNTAYNVNDIVTWAEDGHLYEVIKTHTSSNTLKPGNTEYYKAMTAHKLIRENFDSNFSATAIKKIGDIAKTHPEAIVGMFYGGAITLGKPIVSNGTDLYIQVMARGVYGTAANQLIIGNAYSSTTSPTAFYDGMGVKGALIDFNGETPTINRLTGTDSDAVKIGINPRYIEYLG